MTTSFFCSTFQAGSYAAPFLSRMRKQVRGQRDAQALGVNTVLPEDPSFLPNTAQAGHNPKGIRALASEGGTYHTQTQSHHNNL